MCLYCLSWLDSIWSFNLLIDPRPISLPPPPPIPDKYAISQLSLIQSLFFFAKRCRSQFLCSAVVSIFAKVENTCLAMVKPTKMFLSSSLLFSCINLIIWGRSVPKSCYIFLCKLKKSISWHWKKLDRKFKNLPSIIKFLCTLLT